MLKLRFISIILLVLVIFSLYADAQQRQNQQNQRKKHRKQQQQLQQQQQYENQTNKQQSNKINNKKPNKANKIKGEKPAEKFKKIINEIPGLGTVKGRTVKTEWSGKHVFQFFDIPYAKAPTGAMRFKPSVAITPWTNTLNAAKPHHGCPSLQDMFNYDKLIKKNIDVEDCLRLTINTKALKGSAPVMVYIHGDFLYDGSSLEAAPGYLLEEDVVLVGVRYRLGPFGFLSTMSEDIPGNAGVSDVILALQWIQNHIGAFGGDPSRVTLFGQVAGAALINILTMSPAVPECLFHQVIYQSGSALSPSFITDNPLTSARDIAQIAGCKNVKKIETLNKCLHRLNTTELLEAFSIHGSSQAKNGVGHSGAVQFVVGGPSGILPLYPAKLLASGKFKAVPTMGGSVKHGGSFTLKDIYIDNFNETIVDDIMDGTAYINHIISQTNGADPKEAWKKYAEEEIFTADQMQNGTFYDLTPGLIDLCSTISFKNPVLLAMQGNANKLPNSTYLYSFDYEGELNRYTSSNDDANEMPFDSGVSLTDDNLYLFPWPRYSLLNSNRDIKIAKRMVALWTSFATSGKPSAPNMPEWPPMTDETGPYMKLDRTVSIGENFIDEFTVAVKETQKGYNLLNEDFFDSLVEITENETEDSVDKLEEDDEDDDTETDEARGNRVIIARRSKQ